jgi:ligand-binding sensor protein
MNADNAPLEAPVPCPPSAALQRSQVVRDYQKHFAEATGLPLKFAPREIPDESGALEIDGAPFCDLLARNVDSCTFCQKIHTALQARANDANHPTCTACFAAMGIAAVPVIVSGENLGSLVAGQVHLVKPTTARFGKMFKPTNGMTFTECPFRACVEKAKRLLADPARCEDRSRV